MYPVSEAFHSVIYNDEVNMQVRVVLRANGKTYYLGHEDIVKDSLKITYRVLPEDGITPGGVCAADLAITLTNHDGKFNNVQLNYAEIRPFIDVETAPGVFETVPMGVFDVDTADRLAVTFDRNYEAIPLQAADRMVRLDLPFSQVDVSFPCTALQLLTLICQRCGVPLGSTNFMNADYVIQEPPEGDISCRDVVSYIAEMAGCWAQCDRQGMLVLKWFKNPGYVQEAEIDGNDPDVHADGGNFTDDWYMNTYDGGVFREEEPDIVLSAEAFYDFSIDDAPIEITGVSLQTETETFLIGSPRYVLALDNPLIQTNIPEILSGIHEKLSGFSYIPFRGECIDNPAMEAGDMVLLADIEGKSYRSIITSYEYKFDGRCKIEASGMSEREHNYRAAEQRRYSRLIKTIGKKQEQIDALDRAIANGTKMLVSAMGGHIFNGADIGYPGEMFIADNADIALAKHVWRYNVNGWGHSSNGINGPYDMGATADNSLWANMITAAMIRTGLLKSLNGKSWINLDDGSFNLGDGSLVYNGNTFEAISAEKITNKNSDGTFVTIGKGPNSTDRYGMFLTHPTQGSLFNIYPFLLIDWSFMALLVNYYGDIINFQRKRGSSTYEFLNTHDNATELVWTNAGGSSSASVSVGQSGISFEVNGNPHGITRNFLSGEKPIIKNGLVTGWY